MKMVVEFDISADIIDVPEWVILEREALRRRFLKWLYSWDGSRRWKRGGCYCYRSDAFVEWLNRKVLREGERAEVLEIGVREWDERLPDIFF